MSSMASGSSSLPIAHLESLRSKATQIIESIGALHQLLALDNPQLPYMPTWPDILARYNLLLSQTHSFYASLLPVISSTQNQGSGGGTNNANASQTSPYEKLALHPTQPLSDAQLDAELVPLLRNQQTTEVLRAENETVRRIAESMTCKGSIGVLSSASQSAGDATTVARSRFGRGKKPTTYQDVLSECTEIRTAHDKRAERAVRAVMMLRDKFEWKARVEVEVEEPEELGWDPRLGMPNPAMDDGVEGAKEGMDVDGDESEDDDDEGGEEHNGFRGDQNADEGGSSEDEQMIEGVLAAGTGSTGGLTPI